MTILPNQSIAIIGTGISGLGIASLLHPHQPITVYEKNDYIGGHARTLDLSINEHSFPVDTGFIVFNHRNYPLLTRLFSHLKVPTAPSNMSFGVTIQNGWLEYGTPKPHNLFAQKRNLFRPAFWKMLTDILRFNANAQSIVQQHPTISLHDCLTQLNMGHWFIHYYLLAMGGAIWSTPLANMHHFPARSFIQFFNNHGLLTINSQPQWHTVQGGSRTYINRLISPFKSHIRTQTGATHVARTPNGVSITDTTGHTQTYDHVVFACHAPQTLALLHSPTPAEHAILSAFTTQPNRAILHRDTQLMPQRRHAWSSWVYRSHTPIDQEPHVSLTYWMNNLQPLPTTTPVLVTLNPSTPIPPHLIDNDHTFYHPLFDQRAIQAQSELSAIQGVDRIWFCGAYQRYGFHEDGLASAVAVAEQMGITPPW